jgi:pseudoazurin
MLRNLTAGLIMLVMSAAHAGTAMAESHDVLMLNRGEAGTMVFEPAFLQIAAGDTVRFVPTDRSHNAESVEGMLPEGSEPFAGRINEEIEVTFDVEGLYGVKCTPHFAMGMVMIIAVGENVEQPEDFLAGRIPPRAKERFEEALSNL